MKKTLHYRRHSIKEGSIIGVPGLELAFAAGTAAARVNYTHAFHGMLVRTAQTLLEFLRGWLARTENPRKSPRTMPIVAEIGSDELFGKMATAEFKAAVKAGASNFQALFQVHSIEQIKLWAEQALRSITVIFDQMEDGGTAIAIGHSPVIELAAWAVGEEEFFSLPEEYARLEDLAGIVFTQTDLGITVGPKISPIDQMEQPGMDWS